MIKIEAVTLEQAYKDAAATLKCSVTEMAVEVVQAPSSGFLGLLENLQLSSQQLIALRWQKINLRV
jgi:predicted RNA-binding protein Jag